MTELRSRHDPLDSRRRRARFRAWRRGTREMDLILGAFADARVGMLSDGDLDDFEALMEVSDTDLFGWIAGGSPVADPFDRPVLRAIIGFHKNTHLPGRGR